MKYAFVFYEAPAAIAMRGSDEAADYFGAWGAYMQAMRDAGILVGGQALQPPTTATTVRFENGKPLVQDGPYADTKEQIGGYAAVELPSLEEALSWADRCPCANGGYVEVRPVMQM